MWQGSEHARVTQGFKYANMSLYKLMSTYRDRRIQNPVKDLRWSPLENLL